MKTLSILAVFTFLVFQVHAQNPLAKFEGNWVMVPGSLKSDPVPESIDLSTVNLEVTCKLDAEGHSVTCTYRGGKTISQVPFKSKGREMMVLDPETQAVYKLGLTNNAADHPELEYEKTMVNIGKGVFNEKGDLELQEYIAGDQSPAGAHIYKWKSADEIHEYSVNYDEDGNKILESFWVLKRKIK